MEYEDGKFHDPLEDQRDEQDVLIDHLKKVRGDKRMRAKLQKLLQESEHPAAAQLEEDLDELIHLVDQLGLEEKQLDEYYQSLIQYLSPSRAVNTSSPALYNSWEFIKDNPDVLIFYLSMFFAMGFAANGMLEERVDAMRFNMLMSLGFCIVSCMMLSRRNIKKAQQPPGNE